LRERRSPHEPLGDEPLERLPERQADLLGPRLYRAVGLIFLFALLVVPFIATNYWLNSILVPFLVFSIAAIGLNILTGYCGQVSLGTGGFMACGAFFTFKLTTWMPEVNILLVFLMAGFGTALFAFTRWFWRFGLRHYSGAFNLTVAGLAMLWE
jgi:ABC-type branched-subunit amino acid transport system permease subunit